MDVDAVVAEVASAVGLAEGQSGVRDILRAIARREPVAAREVSRAAELPVPLVTAVCNELRKRGVVDRGRPVRLTPEGRSAFGWKDCAVSSDRELTLACEQTSRRLGAEGHELNAWRVASGFKTARLTCGSAVRW